MSHSRIDHLLRSYRQSRDAAAIAELFDLCADSLFATAQHLLGDAQEAEDAVQDTFLALIRGVDNYDPARPAMPFLVGVLQHHALYRARRNRRRPDRTRTEEVAASAPDQLAESSEAGAALRDAITGLPDIYRDVLTTILDEGVGPAEIAHRVGEAPGTIRARIHRGLAKLRKRLPVSIALPTVLLTLEGRSMAAIREVVVAEASRGSAAGTATAKAIKSYSVATAAKVAGALAIAVIAGVGVAQVGDRDEAASPANRRDFAAASSSPSPLSGANVRAEAAADEPRAIANPAEAANRRTERATVEPLPIRQGEFAFHYEQGYSFAGDALVPADQADLVFERCAGGISSITFATPGGGVHLPISEQKIDDAPCSLDCYLRSVISLDESLLEWEDDVRTDDRDLLSNAFLVRTRRGGFAVCTLDERGKEGGWKEKLATIRYVYNPSGPWFVDHAAQADAIKGVKFDMTAFLTDPWTEARRAELALRRAEYERRLTLLKAELAALDATAIQYARSLGVSPSADEGVAAVLSRQAADEILGDSVRLAGVRESASYVAATYSFELATRDDVDATRNDWDMVVTGAGPGDLGVRVCTVTDDRSRLWSLPPGVTLPLDQERVAAWIRPEQEEDPRRGATVAEGRAFLIFTLDSDSRRWTAIQILSVTEQGGVIFRWSRLSSTDLLEKAARRGMSELRSPVVRVQMRTGAGGGNPNRVFLDGSKNAYLDEISPTPLDMTTAPDMNEPARAWIESGVVPEGKVWVVTAIDYFARAPGDGNGHGEFKVGFKNDKLIEVPDSEEPVRDRWTGRLDVRLGDEARFYVEAANSTLCDVTIHGRFEDDERHR